MRSDSSNGISPSIRKLGLVLRFALSFLLVAWLVSKIDLRAAVGLLAEVRAPWLAAAIASLLATYVANCFRWRLCLFDLGSRVSLRTLIFSYWTSLFVGLALPTEYGGDLLRIKDLRKRLESDTKAVVGVALSRLSGIGAAFVVFSLAGLANLDRLKELSLVWVWGVAATGCAVVGLVAALRPGALFELLTRLPFVRSRLPTGSDPAGTDGRVAFAAYRGYGRRILLAALAVQVLAVLTNWFYVAALKQSVTVFDMALVTPLLALSTLVPLSIAGIGVKDGVLVVCLTALGVAPEAALSVALLKRLVFVACALLGGLLFPFRRRLLGDQG